MQMKSYLTWAICGCIAWMLFGTVATVLIAFKPPLTFIPLRHSLVTILVVLLMYGITGVVLGLMGRGHYENMGFVAEGAATTMFVSFWGLILGAVVMALVFITPAVEGAEMRPIFERCAAGSVAGLLAGNFMMVLGR